MIGAVKSEIERAFPTISQCHDSARYRSSNIPEDRYHGLLAAVTDSTRGPIPSAHRFLQREASRFNAFRACPSQPGNLRRSAQAARATARVMTMTAASVYCAGELRSRSSAAGGRGRGAAPGPTAAAAAAACLAP